MPDPMDPIVKIGERLAEVARSLGLDLQTFVVVPDFHGTSHHVQAIFSLTEDREDAPEELPEVDPALIDPLPAEVTKDFDDELAAILAATDEAEEAVKEEARRAEKAKEDERLQATKDKMLDMRARFEAGKSVLDD